MNRYLLGSLCVLHYVSSVLAELEPEESKGEIIAATIKSHVAGLGAVAGAGGGGGGTTEKNPVVPNLGFIHAFIASLSVILVSEIGDKTFFIAAIMAMRHPRITVFVGAISALALMTVLSVVFGLAATVIPRVYTYYISILLFIIFGIKMLLEGLKMSPNEAQQELEGVQSDLRRRDDEFEREALTPDVETGSGTTSKIPAPTIKLLSRIVVQAFTLTFLAEWGDRSQLTTIVLAATEDPYGVTLGGVFGHSICTGIAVVGGRFIAQRISVRTVTIIGGIVFLIFAVTSLMFEPSSEKT